MEKKEMNFLRALIFTVSVYNSEQIYLIEYIEEDVWEYSKKYLEKELKTKEETLFFLWQQVMPKLLEKYRKNLLIDLIYEELEGFQEEEFAYKNKEQLSRFIIRKKEEIEKEVPYECFPIENTIELVKKYLKDIDRTGYYLKVLETGIKEKSICIWNKKKEIPDIVKEKLDVYEYFTWEVVGEPSPFLNAPYEETIQDGIALIHEFFHFATVKEKKDFQKRTIAENFLGEFASCFHEKNFYFFLKNTLSKTEDLDSYFKKRECFTNDYVDCLKILFTPKIKEEDLKYLSADFIEEFCGNLIINEGIYINCYRYFVANVMKDYLLKKIKCGKDYLLKRIKDVNKMLGISDMDPLYFINYLECFELFYDFEAIQNVYPKRIEGPILERVSKNQENLK